MRFSMEFNISYLTNSFEPYRLQDILERLLHHSHVIKMVGPSYRTKDYYDLVDVEDK